MAIDYGTTGVVFDEEVDLKNYAVWICEIVHGYPAWAPLFIFMFCEQTNYGMQRAAERLSCPETKGWEWKIRDGYPYVAVNEPKPEEIPAREKLFRENIAAFIENPEEKWAKDRDWIIRRYKPIQEVNIEKLSLYQLRDFFFDIFDIFREVHDIHFYWMYGLYLLNFQFIDACEELAGIKPDDPIHVKLRSGFDNLTFQISKGTWLLGDKASEMGLADLFLTIEDDEALMSKLRESEAGRKWLDEYLDFLKVHGWRCLRLVDWASPSLIEQPSLGLPDVRRAIAKGGAFTLDVGRERLATEREQAERELMAKIPEGQRGWFGKLLRMAQMSGWWTEDHTPLVELALGAVPRKVVWEIGKRFARAGVIDEPFDIFMLLPWEISKAIVPLERVDYRRLAQWRKEEWHKALKLEPTPFLGQIEKLGEMARKDPIIRVVGALPLVRPELKADLYGAASSPGVAEGVARVIMSEKQVGEVKPGEILVAPFTATPWVSVFHIVKGVVTDMGGGMAHAVIMGREFGIPVVAGTLEGTKKIKTGQRIRVDGDNIAVYILEQGAK